METIPVKWPLWWRIIILLNISVYNMLGNMFAAGITVLFVPIIEEFHCTISEASSLASYALLALGLSNLWAVATYQYIGKRYTILLSLAAFTACNIWAAKTTSFNELFATRIVGGLFSGVVEALGPAMVVELFHDRELATAMAIYVGFLAAGSSLGPVLAGIIGSGTGNWRWFFGFLSIVSGANLVTCFLMLPESTATRDMITTLPELDANESEKEVDQGQLHEIETVETESSQIPGGLVGLWIRRSLRIRPSDIQPEANWFILMMRPFVMLPVPCVLITIIVFGLTIGWTVISSIVLANVYSSPPLLWTSEKVGLLSLAPLIGILLGIPIGGLLADRLSNHQSNESDDRHHRSRKRLPIILLGGIISPAGVLTVGLTLDRQTSWVGPAVGWGMLTFGLTASSNVLLSHAVNMYPSRSGDTGILVNVVKNIFGFAVSLNAMSWFASDGAEKQYATMAGVLWAAYLLVIPLYWLSDKLHSPWYWLH